MKTCFIVVLTAAMFDARSSASERGVPIPERAKGAPTIVVATVIESVATFERSGAGDQLIVSHLLLQVEETLKGQPPQILPLDVEGGTVGDLTLRVSDMDAVAAGDRGVFFVTRSRGGANVPHLRGNGIVKLDRGNRVRGSSTTLDDVKRLVKQGAQ